VWCVDYTYVVSGSALKRTLSIFFGRIYIEDVKDYTPMTPDSVHCPQERWLRRPPSYSTSMCV
jgi:hypothetical protein